MVIAGRATGYADRRRAAAERLSKTADIARQLDAVVAAAHTSSSASASLDPEGTVRASIRALVPLACRTPGYDVTISLGEDRRCAVRLRHTPDGVTAELVPGTASASDASFSGGPDDESGRDASRGSGTGWPGKAHPAAPSEAQIAAELAAWLWTGEVVG